MPSMPDCQMKAQDKETKRPNPFIIIKAKLLNKVLIEFKSCYKSYYQSKITLFIPKLSL